MTMKSVRIFSLSWREWALGTTARAREDGSPQSQVPAAAGAANGYEQHSDRAAAGARQIAPPQALVRSRRRRR